jgi:hypothetical protein
MYCRTALWFPLGLALAIGLKMILVSDLAVLIQYAPHDDGLYVVRAYHLLTSGDFGPYDARTLVKLPGMSFWLAGGRLLGLPYLWSINVFYMAAGCYFIAAVRQCGVSRLLALAAFVVYLFSPITMGNEWVRLLREPLSTGLLVVLFASALFILLRLKERRYPLGYLLVFSLVFAFSLLLREEDVLLYGVLLMLGVAAWWTAKHAGMFDTAAMRVAVLSLVAVPLVAAGAANTAASHFIEHHYGLRLLHDFSEGEFPRLIAAIRGIESKKDNRLVMITQERLAKLLVASPRLAPVIKRLPPPGLATYSCQLYKVCTEWANGWMLYWIKDAAQLAGLTPDLPRAQEFFRAAREDIERACRDGTLKCRPNGTGLVPPFELRWTRAYLQELFTLLSMTAIPNPHLAGPLPDRYEVDANFGRIFQFVTLTHNFDTEVQSTGHTTPIARYANPLASWRGTLGDIYHAVTPWLALLVVAAFAVRVSRWRKVPPDPLSMVLAIVVSYTLIRIAALAYPAVYFGHFDNRIVYSTHSLLLLTALFVLTDAANAMRAARRQGERVKPENSIA